MRLLFNERGGYQIVAEFHPLTFHSTKYNIVGVEHWNLELANTSTVCPNQQIHLHRL